MASEYDAALATLYQVPHERFVAERKRLAAELKTAGDKHGASKLAKLERPPISAWAVNQLYWRERKALEQLLATAESWRKGGAGAAAAHRDAATSLRNKAAKILSEAGHSANEATLRRVSSTLSALAAGGGFDPDPPGALRADRDPPGFGVLEGAVLPASPSKAAAKSSASRADENENGDEDDSAEQQREAKKADQRRQEEERKRRQAEQKRLEMELRNAKSQVETHSRELARLEKRRAETEAELARAQAKLEKLETELESLNSE